MNHNASTRLSGGRARRPTVLQAVRTAALVLYAFHIALGVLFFPASAISGLATGLGTYWIVISLRREAADDFPRLAHPVVGAAIAGGLPPALSGFSVTGTWGALALALLVIGGAVLSVHWIGSYTATATTPGCGHGAVGGHGQGVRDDSLMRQVLTTMPTELLLDEWESTQSRLTAGVGDPLREVRLREMLIDELRDRDPVGTARWLSEGPADLPDLYIRPDPGPGD